jgi:hypothetical protein
MALGVALCIQSRSMVIVVNEELHGMRLWSNTAKRGVEFQVMRDCRDQG